jgi:hypothetical protein
MTWIALQTEAPKVGEWVLVWDSKKGFPIIAKWSGKYWKAVANNTKAESGAHWCRVRGPNGEACGMPVSAYELTKRDSQHA